MKIHGVVQLEVTTDTATGKPALILTFPDGMKQGITTNIAEMIGGAGKGLREKHEQGGKIQ